MEESWGNRKFIKIYDFQGYILEVDSRKNVPLHKGKVMRHNTQKFRLYIHW